MENNEVPDWYLKQMNCPHNNVDAYQDYDVDSEFDQYIIRAKCYDCGKIMDDE